MQAPINLLTEAVFIYSIKYTWSEAPFLHCPAHLEKSVIYVSPKYYPLANNILLPKTLVINRNICLLFSYKTLRYSKAQKVHYGKM